MPRFRTPIVLLLIALTASIVIPAAASPGVSDEAEQGLETRLAAVDEEADAADADLSIWKWRRPSGRFPEHRGVEYERSKIKFRVCKVKKDLTPEQEEARKRSTKCCDPEFYDVEHVELRAYMKLVRQSPVTNQIGIRELRFTIEEWELFGWSELYDAHITFSRADVVQPLSVAIAGRKANQPDFPAIIIYNAIYDIYLDGKKIVSAEPGVAMATGVREIPPRNITVAFQKPVDTDIIRICPGTCEDMMTITREEFEAGLAEARRIRAGEATLEPGAEGRRGR